jgi:hypothetical protein
MVRGHLHLSNICAGKSFFQSYLIGLLLIFGLGVRNGNNHHLYHNIENFKPWCLELPHAQDDYCWLCKPPQAMMFVCVVGLMLSVTCRNCIVWISAEVLHVLPGMFISAFAVRIRSNQIFPGLFEYNTLMGDWTPLNWHAREQQRQSTPVWVSGFFSHRPQHPLC